MKELINVVAMRPSDNARPLFDPYAIVCWMIKNPAGPFGSEMITPARNPCKMIVSIC